MNEDLDNPEHWKWGVFYFNPQDKRVIVPKRIPMFGLTLNFANPYSFLVIALLIIAIVILTRLSV